MKKALYAAEFVFPGHPDKLCDAIVDAVVAEASRREKRALCGVEAAVHRSSVFVTGRVACVGAEEIDIEGIARMVFESAGYGGRHRPAPEELVVRTDLCTGPLLEGEAEFRAVSDDQSIVTGYAVDIPGTNWLPPEQWLASVLSRRTAKIRCEAPDLLLGPDGKVILDLEERDEGFRVASASASLQQEAEGDPVELHRRVLEVLGETLAAAASEVPGLSPEVPGDVTVNGAGNFAVGGPEGDNGLSGKKLVVDGYGPRVPVGGGALSGKDLYKADRAGAILARRLAKAVVLAGAARECTAKLRFHPGARRAAIVSLRDGEGREIPAGRWEALFDLSLESVGDRFTGTEDLVDVARYGHFTRPERAWERVSFE